MTHIFIFNDTTTLDNIFNSLRRLDVCLFYRTGEPVMMQRMNGGRHGHDEHGLAVHLDHGQYQRHYYRA